MGMSLNLYICSKESFNEIKKEIMNSTEINYLNYAVKSNYFEKTYQGLEYVLIKMFGDIMRPIFNPTHSIGSINFKSDSYKNLSFDERVQVYINTQQASYLTPDEIDTIWNHIKDRNENDIDKYYNAVEMNNNKIYPEIWEEEYVEGHYPNAETIKNEYIKLKEIIFNAMGNDQYIFIEIK
jgi:hypothetical protein